VAQAAAYRLSICAAAALVFLLVVRELRVPQALAASAEPANAAALALPADVVSIPTLALNGRVVKVGDLAAAAESALPASAVLRRTSDRGAVGAREIRTYQLDGETVTVVLEPFETQGAVRVAAIYLR